MTTYHVKEQREKLGMTQTELVKRSGVCRTTIYLLENNADINVQIGTLNSIARVLKCDVEALYTTK